MLPRRVFRITILLICSVFCKELSAQSSPANDSGDIYLADPTIFADKGQHYLYGTGSGAMGNGFLAYTSSNLKNWKLIENNNGYCLRKGDAFGSSGFWAPQVFKYESKYFFAYVANENIAIAEGHNPAGPFIQKVKQPLAAPVKQIDPFIFIDDDGRKYLYHVRLTNGNKIFVAELNDDFSTIKEETLRECITATEKWENISNAKWPVTEGPSILKHKGIYYLFYSANDYRNKGYAVGYATSTNPMGPWTKYPGNPILYSSMIQQAGPGHGDFIKKKNQYYYVFHTHHSLSVVHPRKTAIIKGAFYKKKNTIDRFGFKSKSFYYLKRATT
ncbi:MAG: glycoside hydrolase family 43 protein [Candidatus Dadabacteria bacterium]